MARGLRNAARIVEQGVLDELRRKRYSSWSDSKLGRWERSGGADRGRNALHRARRAPLERAAARHAAPPHPSSGVADSGQPRYALCFCRDISEGSVGFEELERAALAEPDPWTAGLPSGGAEMLEILLSRYIR